MKRRSASFRNRSYGDNNSRRARSGRGKIMAAIVESRQPGSHRPQRRRLAVISGAGGDDARRVTTRSRAAERLLGISVTGALRRYRGRDYRANRRAEAIPSRDIGGGNVNPVTGAARRLHRRNISRERLRGNVMVALRRPVEAEHALDRPGSGRRAYQLNQRRNQWR